MGIVYSEQASEIVEQCLLPILLTHQKDGEWDFTNREQEILQDVFPVMEAVRILFLPYQEKIKSYHLTGYGMTLLQSCYLAMIEAGKNPKTMEEVHEWCLLLSEEEIKEHLSSLVNTEIEHMDKSLDFWERLEKSTADPETKWYMSRFYRNPRASMATLVKLSKVLCRLYKPYLEKGRAEKEKFASVFSLEEFFRKSNYLSQFDLVDFNQATCKLYILSPWLVRFASYKTPEIGHFFIISCRVDQILLSHQELDIDVLSTTLKTMSDATRYNVLVELTKPHAKSKDIAEALGITGAAVSFHTQKLINAQLLLFNRKNKNIKYNVNKQLLQQVIAKMQVDFQLDDKK